MFKFESGTVIFPRNFNELQIGLNKEYVNNIVVKITPTENVNINLSVITNTYFTIEKSVNEEITVHYIVIESES
jgi:hypothetical protein